MIKKLSFFLFFVLVTVFCNAQFVKQWDKRFGGVNQEWLFDFHQTADGGYILGGASSSDVSGDKTQSTRGSWDYWIIKLDSAGNKQWDKRFGGSNEDDLYSVTQTRDGGYILGGSSYSLIGGDKTQTNWDAGGGTCDYWIVKTDSLGNYQWDKRYGTPDWDYFSTVIQTADGGYLMGGDTYGDTVGDKTQHNWDPTLYSTDYWIVKTDSLGNKLWDKRYGGDKTDNLHSIKQTADGGYILGGQSYSGITGDKTDTSRGGNDYWIVKIDTAGNVQWDKTYGGIGADYFGSLQQTTDHGYILGGYSTSGVSGEKTQPSWGGFWGFDFWVVKIDSVGNKEWDKDFGGTGDEDGFGNVFQTLDGGYLVAGSSYSGITGTKSETNLGPEQMWVTKLDTAGIKQWDKTMFTNDHDEIGYAIQTTDGCYTMANYTAADSGGYKTQPNRDATRQSCDFWIIRFCDTTQSLPVSNFSASQSVFCEGGGCINFFDSSSGNPTSWKWLFPGATPNMSNQQNPTGICYNNPGTYPVTLIVTNATGTDTLTISPMIFVSSGATPPTLILSNDTIFSSHASAYQWYRDGSLISGATDSFYVYNQSGTYSVRITDSIGCTALSSGLLITDVRSTKQKELNIKIYPNPVGDQLVIGNLTFVIGEIDIFDVLGEKVYFASPLLSRGIEDEVRIDVSFFAKGVYIVKLIIGNDSYRARVVKQ